MKNFGGPHGGNKYTVSPCNQSIHRSFERMLFTSWFQVRISFFSVSRLIDWLIDWLIGCIYLEYKEMHRDNSKNRRHIRILSRISSYFLSYSHNFFVIKIDRYSTLNRRKKPHKWWAIFNTDVITLTACWHFIDQLKTKRRISTDSYSPAKILVSQPALPLRKELPYAHLPVQFFRSVSRSFSHMALDQEERIT